MRATQVAVASAMWLSISPTGWMLGPAAAKKPWSRWLPGRLRPFRPSHSSGASRRKLPVPGGALALGHPLGATGARITGKAAALLKREGKGLALATQCIGGGQGIATVLEAC